MTIVIYLVIHGHTFASQFKRKYLSRFNHKKHIDMKKFIITVSTALFLFACGNKENKSESEESKEATEHSAAPKANPSYDPNRGIGKFSSVDLGDKLDKKMADAGQSIYDVKCSSCHKLTEEKLVGPGWKGVTKRY